MAAGDFYIRRNDAETSTLPNAGTNLDATWDTEVYAEGSAATYSAGTYTITNAGPHLIMYSERFSTTDTTNNERIEAQGRLVIGGTVRTEGACEGYIRKSSNQQEMVINGSCIYRTTAASTSLVTRFSRGDNSTTGTVGRDAGFGGVQILQLSDSDAFARYSTNATQTVSTTEANVTSWTNDEQDTGFSRSTDTVTISAAGRYVMSVSGVVSITGTSRTEGVIFAENGTTEIAGARGHFHMRGIDGNQDGAFNFTVIIDVAASDTITLRKDLTGGSTPTIATGMVWQFWKLPSGNETAIMEATTGDQNAVGVFTWDTLPHIDTAAFTASAASSNIDVDQICHVAAFWQMGKKVVDTPQRAYPMSRLVVSGATLNYAAGGSYHRNSSSIGTFMSQGAASIATTVAPNGSIEVRTDPLGATGVIDVESGHFSVLNLEGLYTTYTYPPAITDFDTDEHFNWGDTNLVITGAAFEATQGTGKVEFWSDITGTIKTTQTVDTWSATSIQIDTVRGSLPDNTLIYLVVTTNGGLVSPAFAVDVGLAPYHDLILSATSPDHYWRLNNVYSDTGVTGPTRDMTSGVVGTWTFSTTKLSDSNTHSLIYNSTTLRREIVDSANMNITIDSGERTLAFWFQLGGTQNALACIWKEGGGVQNLAFFTGYGNTIIFQGADTPGNAINAQAWSDFRLAANRPYHICGRYSLTETPKELRLYIDGVEQTASSGNPLGTGSFNSHSGDVTWGDPDTNLETGGTDISYNTCDDALLSDFATWSDNSGGTNAGALDKTTEIRDVLFRRGAPPDIVIDTDTEANMQTDLDTYADTERRDWPLCIRVNAVSGGGNFELVADNVTFNSLATLQVEYRGSDTLTWVNTNGSNLVAAKAYAPNGGTITIVEEVPVVVTVRALADNSLISSARVLVEAASGGDLAAGTDILTGVTNGSGVLSGALRYTSDQPVQGRVRRATTGALYKTANISATITNTGLALTVFLVGDE